MRAKAAFVAGVATVAVAWCSAAPAGAVGDATVPQGSRQTVSGTAAAVPDLNAIVAPVIVTMTHDGASNFVVRPVDKSGNEGISWANEIGAWTGTIFQAKPSVPIIAASVEADGNWMIAIKPLAAAPVVSSKSYAGTGTAVIKFRVPSTGFKRIRLSHEGESNFIVRPIMSSGSEGISLVNEIGSYTGTKVLPKGTRYLSVIADGSWTLRVS